MNARYGYGWTDWREIHGLVKYDSPLNDINPNVLMAAPLWTCLWCRSQHDVAKNHCPNCGAPR